MRRRLDQELIRRSLAESRSRAAELIEEGRVRVSGAPALKASRLVDAGEPVVVDPPAERYVGRGGFKLHAALEAFRINVEGKLVLDVGASTGGFTDCLLQAGASRVVALDVGHGQLHPKLRQDPRVECIEHVNIRLLADPAKAKEVLGPRRFPLVTVDVSFISLSLVLPVVFQLLAPPGEVVALVKPQFEVGKQLVDKTKGVLQEDSPRQEALSKVRAVALAHGAEVHEVIPSPIRGAKGNVEYLMHLGIAPATAPAAQARAEAGDY
jgi:23S rRNA (cytidine1920-2'-O)/16S rRNA (cytidine1409-2'-O)-methyltransferase